MSGLAGAAQPAIEGYKHESMQSADKIKLYRSLFRGRDDVFAKRSSTTGAYFPEHTLNWDEFNAHKANAVRAPRYTKHVVYEISLVNRYI